ncbi:hypothetical protein C5612_10070 [Pseudomonas frederiksbergensis]|uniref:Uncharacterized protein n=1 Tax=Pseudomonas frederiksbergensis TaxID=104087 RepID=A0A2S8HPM5_9PSED|nr:hypothetical protein C5612_10070 [Pseudomonas frederiksbergensis]
MSAARSSRASPLPQFDQVPHRNAVECGSGLARERARPANRSLKIEIMTSNSTHKTNNFFIFQCVNRLARNSL